MPWVTSSANSSASVTPRRRACRLAVSTDTTTCPTSCPGASGVSTARLYALTFALGAALAGLAGALMVPLFSLSADLGVRFLVQAFLSVMLGGIGTFEGPLLGAAMIGAMVPGFQWLRQIPGMAEAVSPVMAEVLVFVTALVIVKFRPSGLISTGRK